MEKRNKRSRLKGRRNNRNRTGHADDQDKKLLEIESKINKFINNFDQSADQQEDDSKKQKNEQTKFKNDRNNNKFLDKKMLVKLDGKWYNHRIKENPSQSNQVSRQKEFELFQEAKKLLEDDVRRYNELNEKSSKKKDLAWVRTVLHKGASADKLAAFTILIQESPVHNLSSLAALIHLVNPKAKRECLMAVDNLRDLFVGDLLVPKQPLRKFGDSITLLNHNNQAQKNRQLILFYFEDQLKQLYRLFLDAVVKVAHDSLETTKNKSLATFLDLVVHNPEQQQFLIENLANKLGDPTSKLASRAAYLLNQLVNQRRPDLKDVVVNEVERVLYRPNVSPKAQYYCLCFLNQLLFRAEDKNLANKMIGIYFGFFKGAIKKGDVDNKLMSAVLSGVTRAFPYSKLEKNILEEHLETFYKIIYFVNFNTRIQLLLLIFNVLDAHENGLLTDRYYCVLYRQLLDPQLDNCAKKGMFLNVVFRSMKKDQVPKRIRAFIKRLLQIALVSSPPLTCSILVLISEVFRANPNLVLTVIKSNEKKVLLDEDDDEDEKYEDVPLSDEDELPDEVKSLETTDSKPTASWVHTKNAIQTKTSSYDSMARNPLYANAEAVVVWELAALTKHYHPSLSLFAQNLIDKKIIDYDGDPLSDFTLKHFLDRFVFRNPKPLNKLSGAVAIQKKVFGRLKTKSREETCSTINTQQYLNTPEDRVPLEERFIYSYLKTRASEEQDDISSDIESVTSEDFEQLLERYEPGFDKDLDFAGEFKSKSKKRKKKDKDEDPSDEDDDDIDFGEDEEFNEAFADVDSELNEALGDSEGEDYDDEEDDDQTPMRPKKKSKTGVDKSTADLFVSADEFAELLEQNATDDSDLSDDEMDNNGEGKKMKTANKRIKKERLGRRMTKLRKKATTTKKGRRRREGKRRERDLFESITE